MLEDRNTTGYKLLFLIIATAVTACLLLLIISMLGSDSSSSQAGESGYSSGMFDTGSSDSANVVTTGISSALGEVAQKIDQATSNADNPADSVGTAAADTGQAVADGGKSVLGGIGHAFAATFRAIGSGFAFIGRGIAGGAVFIFRIPINILGSITKAPAVSAAITPPDHSEVPVIDPNSPALAAAQNALPATQAANPPASQLPPEPLWPMHGSITTEFGVPEWPYQPIHTGIDISDGWRVGVTPIKAYRHGKVVQVSSSGGLGNHVVVDHGGGVTSVYGHLASITAHVGQDVDTSTTLGYEGSTGASTGPHLHFEIRVNGQAANPHNFIAGRP